MRGGRGWLQCCEPGTSGCTVTQQWTARVSRKSCRSLGPHTSAHCPEPVSSPKFHQSRAPLGAVISCEGKVLESSARRRRKCQQPLMGVQTNLAVGYYYCHCWVITGYLALS